jgi:hypothetical protein
MAKFVLALLMLVAAGVILLAAILVLARALVLVIPLGLVAFVLWLCFKGTKTKPTVW